MTAPNYLTLQSGTPTNTASIQQASGAVTADANQIVSSNAQGRLDNSLMPDPLKSYADQRLLDQPNQQLILCVAKDPDEQAALTAYVAAQGDGYLLK